METHPVNDALQELTDLSEQLGLYDLPPQPEQEQPLRTSDIMNRMFEIREQRRELAAKDKELKDEADALEETLLVKMREQGSTRVSNKRGTAIISETIVPSVDDWDAVTEYIKENDAMYLLTKKIASAPFRELIESGQEVPGVRAVTKVDINLRAS
jgi:hypothetical protein